MLNHLVRADKGADLVVRWTGLYVIITGGFSWLNKNLEWFGAITWPQAIFLAIWMGIAALFLVAASLAMVRYFRPLQSASPAPAPNLLSADTAKLDQAAADIASMDLRTKETLSNILQIQNLINDRLDKIEGRITKGEQRFGVTESAMMARFQGLDKILVGQDRYIRKQIAALFQSLAAVYHREQILNWSAALEAGASELQAPTIHGAVYDQEQWEEWEAKERAWRRGLEQWVSLGGCYVTTLYEHVFTVPDDHYKQTGVAEISQFPTPEALFTYKAFCAVLKNWRGWQDEVNRAVIDAAFNGKTTNERPITLGESLLEAVYDQGPG